MSALFSPLTLRSATLRNRVIVSPMCQYSCRDGLPTEWHLVHLGSRAVGGAGMVIAEASAVVPEGRISPSDAGLWNDAQARAWAPVARFVSEHGAVPAIQLAHAGHKASTFAPWDGNGPVSGLQGWAPVGASALRFDAGYPEPRALSTNEVAALPGRFADAAGRALDAGFEAVELHFAHGYLVHSFLSPLTNLRTDAYGGDFERRTRLAVEIAAAVRRVWPDRLPLLARVSATDWADGGWDLPQTVELARRLKAAGVDFLDCSTGGLVPHAKIPAGPGFQVPFAEAVRRETGLPTGAVGFITEPAQAEEIVASGKADAVLLARELLRDPYWPLRAATALGADGPWPKQYLRGKPSR
ncbi:MAG: NADH:flavin oxidoreductase/NADH oxidase [Elusimicrobia bacterium]|nr:NADH:flavin oxidoreductase/NADH oxidase [Elusimicrobiota bacterium]